IDPADLLRIGRLEGDGFSVAVIYHSHVDAGAYFSETDRRQALIGDEPLYPGAAYLVTSVMRGRVDSVAAFRWDAARGDFLPVVPGLSRRVGAARPGARAEDGGRGDRRGRTARHELRSADGARGRDGGGDHRRLPVDRAGPSGQLGDGSRDERDPRGPRRDG